MIEIESNKSVEVIDITDQVDRALRESGAEYGVLLVYSLHTTTGLVINEADSALINDLLGLLQRIVPQGAGYQHDLGDGNAHAHLRATLLGNSLVIPIEKRMLVMGTWQRILFFEFDGPRKRKVFVRALTG
ncbi:MAG TPA: secondary thiamine-phosphate synthase enzyme YjbQ [Methanothrix sp.]|nr:secondary thiamine-phosphate synthase enzyme YjbQ [Methanothrix sp.]